MEETSVGWVIYVGDDDYTAQLYRDFNKNKNNQYKGMAWFQGSFLGYRSKNDQL